MIIWIISLEQILRQFYTKQVPLNLNGTIIVEVEIRIKSSSYWFNLAFQIVQNPFK